MTFLFANFCLESLQIGCSSGFGRRLASSALARGDRVIATARTVENIKIPSSPNLNVLQLDVTVGAEAIKAKLAEAAKIWGQIDVLVNNAGVGYSGLLEEGGYVEGLYILAQRGINDRYLTDQAFSKSS